MDKLKNFVLLSLALGTICAEAKVPFASACYGQESKPCLTQSTGFSYHQIELCPLKTYFVYAIFGFVTEELDPTGPYLTGDFLIGPIYKTDQSLLYPSLIALKEANPNLRLILSIGGESFNNPADPFIGAYTYKLFSQMVSREEYRQQFIRSAIEYAHKYGFDGIDINWRLPGDRRYGGTIEDLERFVQLLKECSEACHAASPPLLLTSSTVQSGTYLPQFLEDNVEAYFLWRAECAQYLDRPHVEDEWHGPYD